METINVIVYKNRYQVHGAIGKINNFRVVPDNYDLGDPIGNGEYLEDAIEDFKFGFNEEIEVNIIRTEPTE